MNDTLRFGTAGLADSYTVKKFDPAAIAAYTAGFGLTAFEYQCGRGVRLAHDKAAALGAACAERNIALSVHAPYYISMSSLEEDKRLHSIDYLLQSCALVKRWAGGVSSSIPAPAASRAGRPHWKRLWTRWSAPLRPATRQATVTVSSARRRWARSTSWAHWTRYWRCARWTAASPLHRLRAPVRPQLRHTVCRGHCRRGLRRPARHTGRAAGR